MQGYFVYLKPQLKPKFKPIQASLSNNDAKNPIELKKSYGIQNAIALFKTYPVCYIHISKSVFAVY